MVYFVYILCVFSLFSKATVIACLSLVFFLFKVSLLYCIFVSEQINDDDDDDNEMINTYSPT